MLGPCQVPPLPNQNLSPFQDVRAHHIGVSTQVYLSKPSILLRDRPVLQQLEGDIFKRLDFVRYRHTLFGWGQDPTQKVFSLCLYHPPAGSYPTARACAYFSWAHALRARARLVTPQTLLKRFVVVSFRHSQKGRSPEEPAPCRSYDTPLSLRASEARAAGRIY